MFVMSMFYPLKKKKIEREGAHGAPPHNPEIKTRVETKS